jgi:hypothetical protein
MSHNDVVSFVEQNIRAIRSKKISHLVPQLDEANQKAYLDHLIIIHNILYPYNQITDGVLTNVIEMLTEKIVDNEGNVQLENIAQLVANPAILQQVGGAIMNCPQLTDIVSKFFGSNVLAINDAV